jgi:hypothetical protein
MDAIALTPRLIHFTNRTYSHRSPSQTASFDALFLWVNNQQNLMLFWISLKNT